jgi:hypothetical protein
LDYYGDGYPNFLQELEVTKGNATLAIEEINAINSSVDGMYLSITGTGEIEVDWEAFWASKLGSRYWKISGIETIQPSEPSPYENYGIWVNSSIALESFHFYFGTESVDRELFTLGGGTGYSYEVDSTQLSTGFRLIPIEYGAWIGN